MPSDVADICVANRGEVALLHRIGLALVAFIAVPSIAAAPASLAGRWKTDDGKGIVAMAPCGAKMCGRIAELLIKEPAGGQRDARNPDKAKRGRMVEGLQIYRSEEHTSELQSLMSISYAVSCLT